MYVRRISSIPEVSVEWEMKEAEHVDFAHLAQSKMKSEHPIRHHPMNIPT
jgi:hypothetical protein